MNVSSQIRQRVFEVAVLLTILVLPSTGIILNRMDAELAQSRQRVEELMRRQDDYFLGEYMSLAEPLETQVRELQQVFTNAVTARSASFSFEVAAAQFRKWLDSQMVRPEWESLPNQRLRERIALSQSGSTNGALLVQADLWPLLNDIKRVYGEYLTGARAAFRDYADPASDQADRRVKEDVDKATASAQQLLALAEEARESGNAVKAFLKNQKPVTPPSKTVRYLLLAGLGILFVFMLMVFRCFVTSQLEIELARRNVEFEHQQQLSHFGQLAASLAHEIRNPLTAISARLYTLQKGLVQGTPEHWDSSVIRDEVRRLDRIVQDFLTLARPSDPKLVTMSAEPFLQKIRDLLAPQCESQSVQLTLDSVVPAPFRADEAQLKQVLINLILNAVESMKTGGKVMLRARQDKTRLRDQDTEVVTLEVEDTGPGIPPEAKDHIFTPFFSTKEGGTGLGLAIAARIVNKHGGDLNFETHLGRGTTFRVVLPLCEKPA